ncbi:MAG: hypothetical protein ACKO32_00420 [Planctomycetia bacterium]
MRFDFSSIPDLDSYITVPEGKHRCRIADVREGNSRDGSTRWNYRLEVVGGEFAGRTAAWDSLTWSERGIFRVKKVLEALGVDVRGVLEIEPADLISRQALVQIVPEEREDPASGRRTVRMRVPYLGYEPLPPGSESLPETLAPVDGWKARREALQHEEEDDFRF